MFRPRRRGRAPAHRESCAAERSDDPRRGGQCQPLLRSDVRSRRLAGRPAVAVSLRPREAQLLEAARLGLDAPLEWPGGARLPARDLLLELLLPAAESGLASLAIPRSESSRYLDVLRDRLETGRTCSRFLVDSFEALRTVPGEDALTRLGRELADRWAGDAPVHTWDVLRPTGRPSLDAPLGTIMTEKLVAVGAEEPGATSPCR